ncbi:hypothetical protein IFE17_04450 [Actinobacillus sp. GY-402]|nr:hypothetical protein IFE17_04450 [Actinobacillus sp. GY-402]
MEFVVSSVYAFACVFRNPIFLLRALGLIFRGFHVGYRLFSVGNVMCVRCYSWFKWLIFCFPFLSFSAYSAFTLDYSSLGFLFTKSSLNSTSGSISTTCDIFSGLSGLEKYAVGNASAKREYTRIKLVNSKYLVIDYGNNDSGVSSIGYLGKWTYGETYNLVGKLKKCLYNSSYICFSCFFCLKVIVILLTTFLDTFSKWKS